MPYGFDIYYLVNIKIMRQIAPIFVAFLEKLNFTCQEIISSKLKRIVLTMAILFSLKPFFLEEIGISWMIV